MSTLSPGSYAVDSNIGIAVLNGEPEPVRRWSLEDEVLLPAPVLGELLYGARRSSHPRRNQRRVLEFAQSMRFVPCDEAVCHRYAEIKRRLLASGRPIPDNDIWIAACCLATGAALASRDSHFDAVAGLTREEWR